MMVHVSPATATKHDTRPIDAFIAPSGARFEYSGARVVSVHGHPTMIDEVMFIRHMSCRARGVRVLGISLGDSQ